jgi:hypothetical protein
MFIVGLLLGVLLVKLLVKLTDVNVLSLQALNCLLIFPAELLQLFEQVVILSFCRHIAIALLQLEDSVFGLHQLLMLLQLLFPQRLTFFHYFLHLELQLANNL